MFILGILLVVGGVLSTTSFLILPMILYHQKDPALLITSLNPLNIVDFAITWGPIIAGIILIRISRLRKKEIAIDKPANPMVKGAMRFIWAAIILFVLLALGGIQEEITGVTLFPESALPLFMGALAGLLFIIGFILLIVGWIKSERNQI